MGHRLASAVLRRRRSSPSDPSLEAAGISGFGVQAKGNYFFVYAWVDILYNMYVCLLVYVAVPPPQEAEYLHF